MTVLYCRATCRPMPDSRAICPLRTYYHTSICLRKRSIRVDNILGIMCRRGWGRITQLIYPDYVSHSNSTSCPTTWKLKCTHGSSFPKKKAFTSKGSLSSSACSKTQWLFKSGATAHLRFSEQARRWTTSTTASRCACRRWRAIADRRPYCCVSLTAEMINWWLEII